MESEDYEKMLDRAFSKVPKQKSSDERFELPRFRTFRSGSKTILSNFNEVATRLRRDQDHILKFLLRELATKTRNEGNQIILQGNFGDDLVNKKLEIYAKEYVYCKECGKPDTKIVKEGVFIFLKCEACGARYPVPKV